MDKMKRKRKEITCLEINKIMMQESGQENTIFTEIQIGPQEEPILREDYLDVEQFKKFKLDELNRKRAAKEIYIKHKQKPEVKS